jgi:chloramphenicol O-acetyltransferase type A
MPRYLDVEQWPRRASFEFFRDYDHPYFNVCLPLEVGALVTLAHTSPDISYTVACHYLALRVANEYEPLRYRLEGGRVLVHERVHAGTTALLGEEELAFMYIEYGADYAAFHASAQRARTALVPGAPRIEAHDERSDMVHFSALPWLAFTSISHARRRRPEDSVPKVAFGRYHETHAGIVMPVSIEVHHALMDGVHVARYVEQLQQYLRTPAEALSAGVPPPVSGP